VEKPSPIASPSSAVKAPRRSPAGLEGAAASGQALGEVSGLSPDEALRRLVAATDGLTPSQVEERLRSVGYNRVAHQARHTVLGELVSRSINPLNLLLLTLATASYFLGDQRAAIVIAIMVVLSISLGFIQEHRSNNAAEELQKMVRITATVRRKAVGAAQDPVEVPIEQLVPGDIVLLSAGDMIPADLRLITAKDLFLNHSTLSGVAMPIEKSLPPMAEPRKRRLISIISASWGVPSLGVLAAVWSCSRATRMRYRQHAHRKSPIHIGASEECL
jgi:P-type Mg2+ transporter